MTTARKQVGIRATYMRGGTSKGVFFSVEDLPAHFRDDSPSRDRLLLRVVGSPDPYGKQIDGMGAATSSTSKVVLISRSSRPDCDVDYRFGQVAIGTPMIDWSGNCGNLTAAVGPFAIARGLVSAPRDGTATVRIWQDNVGKRIIARVPMKGGEVVELGDFELDGVAFPAAEIAIEFLDPGADDGSEGGAMFPTGHKIDVIDVPGIGAVEATLINAGNPTIFIDAERLNLEGTELQSALNGNIELLKQFEAIRAHATVAMGLAQSPDEATTQRPATPKIAFVAPPASHVASSGKPIAADEIDLLVRILSMGQLHHAMTGTGAVAIAVAAAIPGTIVTRALGKDQVFEVRFGHPSGKLTVGAEAIEIDGQWSVTKAVVSRSARRLMDGMVFVPDQIEP